MRKKLVKTGLLIALLIAMMAPLAAHLSGVLGDLQTNDAAHIVEPMMRLYRESAVNSAAAPVKQMMDIEEIWEIEDTRQEAEQPLVAGMRNGQNALGYDAASQTFYCTVGTDFPGDAWPQVELFVRGTEADMPVDAVFIDDYTYDYPSEAVAEGYRYEILAYTESEYQYFGIVFTGLPIVTLHTEEIIGEEYIPACVSVSARDAEPLTSMAQVHLRGGGYGKPIEKWSYRIEFQRLNHAGRSVSSDVSVLGMEPDSDWLLLSNAQNETAIHNYLAFDMWNRWHGDGHMFMQLQNYLVELFVGDEYMGIYQLMQRIDPEREIRAAGGNPATDMAVRVIAPLNPSEKPIWDISTVSPSKIEFLYAAGADAERAFAAVENYTKLSGWMEEKLSDEEFAKIIEEQVDVESFVTYFLFQQAVGLTADNIRNNLYIYMLKENGKMVYHLAPWDMDGSFYYGFYTGDPSSGYRFNLELEAAVRMLDLNVNHCREVLHRIYQEKRDTILSDEAIEEWILGTEQMLAASGAYQRETDKWYSNPSYLYLSDMCEFEKEQAVLIGDAIEKRWPLEK